MLAAQGARLTDVYDNHILSGLTLCDRLTECTGCDWDAGNLEKNWEKHRVAFWEAEEVFFNQPILLGPDPAHSASEERWFALGRTDSGRLLFVVFALRGRLIRVVSARDMNQKERKVYNGHEEENSAVQE